MEDENKSIVPKINRLLELDPYLVQYKEEIERRYSVLQKFLNGIEKDEGGMENFTKAYERYGLKRVEQGTMCREWCPGASAVFIMGEFSEFFYKS